MISIRKYLNAQSSNRTAATEGAAAGVPVEGAEAAAGQSAEALYHLSSAILGGIRKHVLAGAGEDLRSQLVKIGEELRPDLTPEDAVQAGEAVISLLASHSSNQQQTGTNQMVEAQHIFALLNQAIVVLSEGGDRDANRLNSIQEALQRTAKMRDVNTMKASLADAVDYVKTEAAAARAATVAELGRFEKEVSSARDFFGGARLELAGRPEAVAEISGSLKSLLPGEAVYLVAYLCERLSAVTQRYGQGVTDELVSRLIKERLKPVLPGNTMYRWTASSLVAVFSRPRDAEKLRREVLELNRTPLVHKMSLSGRTAVLTISPSHLVAEGVSGSPDPLVQQVDKFTIGT